MELMFLWLGAATIFCLVGNIVDDLRLIAVGAFMLLCLTLVP